LILLQLKSHDVDVDIDLKDDKEDNVEVKLLVNYVGDIVPSATPTKDQY